MAASRPVLHPGAHDEPGRSVMPIRSPGFRATLVSMSAALVAVLGTVLTGPAVSAAPAWAYVVAGDFNGDGRSDLAQFDASTGQWYVGLSSGSGFTTALWDTWSSSVTWVDVRVADFNGDGKPDIAGRNLSTGQWYVGLSSGSSFTTTLWGTWSPSVTWVDGRAADFNGDGKADLAGRVSSTGQWWVGLSSGSAFTTTLWDTWSSSVTWVDVQVADFNGDGKSDLAGRDSSAGQWWVGLSSGSAFTTTSWGTWSNSVNWVDVRVGDFNGDGRPDIAGFNSARSQWWVALSSGTSFGTTLWGTVVEKLPPPSITIANPICVVGQGVSFNGTADWKGASPGQITVWWGDGTITSRGAFPMAHDYVAPASYTISVAATDPWGVGSTSVDVTVGTGLQNCFYRASPKPIAKTASLRPGDHVGVVVSVTDAAGNVLVEPVWISFRPTTGGGTAQVGSTALGPGALPFVTGADGTIMVDYTAPASLPALGVDVLKFADGKSMPTLSMSDPYHFH